jgi:hypothetical protein
MASGLIKIVTQLRERPAANLDPQTSRAGEVSIRHRASPE